MPDITAARPVSGEPVATAWGDQVHDAIEGIQYGTTTLTGIVAASPTTLAVTFPRAYTAPPTIAGMSSTSVSINVSKGSVTATGFTISARRNDGVGTPANCDVGWIAIGTPA